MAPGVLGWNARDAKGSSGQVRVARVRAIPGGPASSMSGPVICFGQQPCGFFPKRFFYSKVATARRLQREIGGRIVYFCHDSDHDHRETTTPLKVLDTGETIRLNFDHVSRIQKKYSPLYAKRIRPGWQERTARVMPRFVAPSLVDVFVAARGDTSAEFCLDMYRRLGLLDGIEVVRSGDPEVRLRAIDVEDYFVDVPYEGELVRARRQGSRLLLHRGGGEYLEVPFRETGTESISPTRDTRLRWMQSVVRCTHYVAGPGETAYLNRDETPEITFVPRDFVEGAHDSWVPDVR